MPNDMDLPDMLDLDEELLDLPTGLDDLLKQSTKQKKVVGSWGFHSHINFTQMGHEETNVWFFEQVFNFLRAYFGLVVPDRMELTTYNGSKTVKKENLQAMTFLDELMLVMKNLNEPIWVIRLHLNLVGFVRSDWNPDTMTRLYISEPASFVVWGGPDETGFQTFSVSYNLFSAQKLNGEDALLWSINQPLLEKSLKKWEKQSGHAIEVTRSNSKDVSLFKHGFEKPAPTSAKPTFGLDPAKGSFEELDIEEMLPDLGDLEL